MLHFRSDVLEPVYLCPLLSIPYLRPTPPIFRAEMTPMNFWKWDEATTMKFVELYKSEPTLWNMFSNQYRNKKSRNAALERIVAAMDRQGFGVADCKVKIKNLRTHYWQEMTKVQNSIAAGADPDSVYTPTVVWFEVLDGFLRRFGPHLNKSRFIRDRLTFNHGFDVPSTSAVTCDSYYIKDSKFLLPVDLELENSFMAHDSPSPVTIDETLGVEDKPDQRDAHPQPKKKSKHSHPVQNLERALHTLKEISKIDKLQKPKRSEYQLFGKMIGNQLEKLPESLALESIKHIQAYLVDQRLKGVMSDRDATGTNDVKLYHQ